MAPMATAEIRRIQDQLRRAVEGGAWHGPALREIIGDLGAGEAARRPLPDVHSPWEIVSHVVAWLETVRRRLDGEEIELGEAEDWPRTAGPDESAWVELRERLARAHEELQRTLERMSDEELERRVPGKTYTNYFMLHGVVQHTLYHAGQIAILKKATGRRGPARGDPGAGSEPRD